MSKQIFYYFLCDFNYSVFLAYDIGFLRQMQCNADWLGPIQKSKKTTFYKKYLGNFGISARSVKIAPLEENICPSKYFNLNSRKQD